MSDPLIPEEPTKFEKLLHETEMGQRIGVERTEGEAEASKAAAGALLEIGEYVQDNHPSLKPLKFIGSAAVHYYQAEALGEVVFVTQTNTLCGMNEMTASNGMSELMKSMMKQYGRKAPTKRSGW